MFGQPFVTAVTCGPLWASKASELRSVLTLLNAEIAPFVANGLGAGRRDGRGGW
jgi:hypothetical protein